MLVLASLISWFGVELLKSILFMIGLLILIPFLILFGVFIIASLGEIPLFRKIFLKKDNEDNSKLVDPSESVPASREPNVFEPTREWRARNYLSGQILTNSAEEQAKQREEAIGIPIEDRYLFQNWSSELRDDLPDTHRYRSMRLKDPLDLTLN